MAKLTQLGIAIVLLGGMITLIGLFPTISGIDPTPGVGIVQIMTILVGYATLTGGANLFVWSAYYPHRKLNLAQQISLRLSMTGLVIATASGLADVLGFGSNPPTPTERPILGPYQTAGMLVGFFLASVGVIVFALTGPSSDQK